MISPIEKMIDDACGYDVAVLAGPIAEEACQQTDLLASHADLLMELADAATEWAAGAANLSRVKDAAIKLLEAGW